MEIVVFCKLVPDLAEDLQVNANGTALDPEYLRFTVNEFDDHALEEALLIKEATDASVIVIAPDGEGCDDALYSALAKGADRALRLTGLDEGHNSSYLASALASILPALKFDVVLTGVQSLDDLDGQVGGLLAGLLGLPYVSVVTSVQLAPESRSATVTKEFAGGLAADYKVRLPAVFGVQAARRPPRYVPIGRIRQVMKTGTIEDVEAIPVRMAVPRVRRLVKPQVAGRAQFLTGTPQEIASKVVDILRDRGIL
jgi:electron transfer flavoprotein beta subunit